MSNVLIAPDLQRSYAICADWLELIALARPQQFATHMDVLEPDDFLEDRSAPKPDPSPDTDQDIFDLASEEALDAIFREIEHRRATLDDLYPFAVKTNLRQLHISVSDAPQDDFIHHGHSIYKACLYMSAVRAGMIDAAAAGVPVDPHIGNHFQICATIAAAGYLNGDAYWFGHPRPDQTSLLEAIKSLCGAMRLGEAASTLPMGSSRFAKDAGVDVVAWRDHDDRRPSKLILYGQCASGMNWEGKPVAAKVQKLDTYYREYPAKHWLPALLTPFPLYMDKENTHSLVHEQALKGFYRQAEAEMGIIIDRLRLVRWAVHGLRHKMPTMQVAVDKLGELFNWSDQAEQSAKLVS